MKKIALPQARQLLKTNTPIALTHRQVQPPFTPQPDELWHDTGSAQPDSEPVSKTLARLLRPGTLVFVLPPHPSEKRRPHNDMPPQATKR